MIKKIRTLVSEKLQVAEKGQAKASFRFLRRIAIPSSGTTWYKSQTYLDAFWSPEPTFPLFRAYFCVFSNYDIVTGFLDPIRTALSLLRAFIQFAFLNCFQGVFDDQGM